MSGLLNFIVYMTVFILLVDRYKANGLISIRHHKELSHDQMPVAARFENADLRSASSGCDTTKIQLFCPNLLHNVANALGHKTNITNDRHILVSYPLIFAKFLFWHPICTMLFVIATAVCLFQSNC